MQHELANGPGQLIKYELTLIGSRPLDQIAHPDFGRQRRCAGDAAQLQTVMR